ncbi:uncharacterized protein LOC114539104 [Dendronephthya gigantea]|uniref:uncharacterized protein LOC114539104 n=1 Tax=Dendronephthya gigantea TaxID=151771 RepID=UPI00106D3553|nr:uncharacterized protein LOC114539104 [Dendronephthya gigantea]
MTTNIKAKYQEQQLCLTLSLKPAVMTLIQRETKPHAQKMKNRKQEMTLFIPKRIWNLTKRAMLKIGIPLAVKISYPKFKDGQATVRDVKKNQNFEYVDDIYQTFVRAYSQKQLAEACVALDAMTPEPMNTMFENKEERMLAVEKQKARRSLVVENVPSTTPISVVLAQEEAAKIAKSAKRAPPRCAVCKNPMKGHKKIKDCPKNQKPSQ